jgi:prepilin-type N-terminal cleavage/methylation domain-containing protein
MTKKFAARTKARTARRSHGSDGFSLVEMMIATAVFVIFMGTAFTAVVEAQRGINTIVARNNDVNYVQSYLNNLTYQVRQATAIATYGGSGPYTQLWIYNSSPPTSWPYKCTIWVYNSSASPTELEAFVSNGTVGVSSPTPPTIAAVSGVGVDVQLSGVSPVSSSGLFQIYSSYPGLVDVDLQVQNSTSGSQSSRQEGSTASQLEVEADDVNISTTWPPTLSPTYPSSTCY